ncbi:hypothetical protein F2P81_001430 [Scophthalmus maximus]|uniref:Uncharacterized protein n=1 Tax=Scophthalmus maximus TaxID=52904 RepID=A0A6A4TQ61_SCOMX|nr:hypothetical protein F2P81_001430 [Scophthalmus maximus]
MFVFCGSHVFVEVLVAALHGDSSRLGLRYTKTPRRHTVSAITVFTCAFSTSQSDSDLIHRIHVPPNLLSWRQIPKNVHTTPKKGNIGFCDVYMYFPIQKLFREEKVFNQSLQLNVSSQRGRGEVSIPPVVP